MIRCTTRPHSPIEGAEQLACIYLIMRIYVVLSKMNHLVQIVEDKWLAPVGYEDALIFRGWSKVGKS